MNVSLRGARYARRCSLALITGAVALTAVPAAHAELRVGQNYRLAHDNNPFRGKDQIALAVNPNNPQHIVTTNANYLTEECEGAASFDGGVTWTQAFALKPPAAGIGAPFLPSCRISNHLGESMFQTLAFGTGNNVYATSITPRSAPFGEQGAGVIIYKSTDGGVTWANGVEAMAGGPSSPTGITPETGPYYELPTLAVQPGAGTGGADRVYAAARDTTGGNHGGTPCPITSCSSVQVAVSNDGGQTFGPRVQASPSGTAVASPDGASEPVIGPDGAVTIAWRTAGTDGTIQIARSTDAGQTWGPAITVTNVKAGGRPSSSHVTPLPSTGSSFPRIAVDKQNGNLYIVYGQGGSGPTAPAGGYQGADHFIAPDSKVYFQRSLNNGATWSTPKLVGDPGPYPGTPLVQTRHPSVFVAPNGRVDIVWEDRRHWYQGPGERNCVHTHLACDDARLGDTYYAWSTNGGQTFTERRINDRSHNNDVGYDYRFGVGWGFGPRLVTLSNDDLLVGWMDSREGNFDTDNLDLYLAKVSRGASATVPQTRVDQPDNVALSLALSKRTYPGGGEATMAGNFATKNSTRVVIVNQNDVAGALAGGVLARANLGPVLLSAAGGLSDAVKAEVNRLNPIGAYVVGDAASLSQQVITDLQNAGIDPSRIERVAGTGDAGNAAEIALKMDKRLDAEKTADAPAFDAAVIANAAGPDAAAAAGLAAARRLPILYVNQNDRPAATVAALTALDINRTLVIGGTGQVSNTVLGQLPNAKRLGGADQYGTSRAVAVESAQRGLPSNVVYAASGNRPMDAALAGFAVGRTTGILVLSPDSASQTVPATAAAADLGPVDRFVVIEPTAAPPGGGGGSTPPPPPPPPPPAATPNYPSPVTCAAPILTRRNASRALSRVDMRLRQRCAGRLTATATVKLRVNGRLRTVKMRTSVRRLSGLNRSVRVTLSRAAQRRVRQLGSLRVTVKVTFTPSVLSATSKKTTRTINVTVRKPRTRR